MMYPCLLKRETPSDLPRDIKDASGKKTQGIRVVFLDMVITICSDQTTHFAQNEVM